MCIGHFALVVLIFLYMLLLIEASKVEHSACYVRGSRLQVATGGSIRFGCQHPAPRRIRSRGHPFRIAAVNKKLLFRSVRAKITRFETFGGFIQHIAGWQAPQ